MSQNFYAVFAMRHSLLPCLSYSSELMYILDITCCCILVAEAQFRNLFFFTLGRNINIILRGRWCNINVLNVHAPSEDKIGDIKDRF
jgi:hypothetical protein